MLSDFLRREPMSPKPRRRSSLAAAIRSAGLMQNFLGVNGLSLPVIMSTRKSDDGVTFGGLVADEMGYLVV